MSRGFAGDFAAVFQFPGWSGRMLTNHFIFAIFQFGFRTLQDPGELAVGIGLAGVNLGTLRTDKQHRLEAGGKRDGVGHVGSRLLGRNIFVLFALSLGW